MGLFHLKLRITFPLNILGGFAGSWDNSTVYDQGKLTILVNILSGFQRGGCWVTETQYHSDSGTTS